MHRQHTADLTTPPTRTERRAEAGADLVLALVLGIFFGSFIIAACLR